MSGDVLKQRIENTQNPENNEVKDFMKSLENQETLDKTVDKLKGDPEFLNQIENALLDNLQGIIDNNESISREDPEGVNKATMMIAYHNISRGYIGSLDYIPINDEEKIIEANELIEKEFNLKRLESMDGQTINIEKDNGKISGNVDVKIDLTPVEYQAPDASIQGLLNKYPDIQTHISNELYEEKLFKLQNDLSRNTKDEETKKLGEAIWDKRAKMRIDNTNNLYDRLREPNNQMNFMRSIFEQCKSDPNLLNRLNNAQGDQGVRIIKKMMNEILQNGGHYVSNSRDLSQSTVSSFDNNSLGIDRKKEFTDNVNLEVSDNGDLIWKNASTGEHVVLNEEIFNGYEQKVDEHKKADEYVDSTREKIRKQMMQKYGLDKTDSMTTEMYENEQDEFMNQLFNDKEFFNAIWLTGVDRQQRYEHDGMTMFGGSSQFQRLRNQIPELSQIKGDRIKAKFSTVNNEKVIVFSGVNGTLTVPFSKQATFEEIPGFDSEQRESFKEAERSNENTIETQGEKRAKYEIEETLKSGDGKFDFSNMGLSSVDLEKVIGQIVSASKNTNHEYYMNNMDITINLEGNSMRWLPSELFSVAGLQKLNLDENYIQGFENFPSVDENGESISYDGLKTIENLSIRNCNLGSLSNEVSEMTNLEYIDVSNNDISGSNLDAIKSCKNLREIKASNNDLSSFPSPNNRSNIRLINVGGNDISNLGDDWSGCSLLEEIYMGKNQIENIPKSLCSLTEVTKLYLADNKLENIPPEIGKMKSMEYLDLSNNSLNGTGTIPSSMGNLTNLEHIDLDGNKLKGDMLPNSLVKLNTSIRLYKNTKKGSDVRSKYFDGSYTRKGYNLDSNHKIREFINNNQKYKITVEEGTSLQNATNKAMKQLNINDESPKYVLHRKNYSGSYEAIVITAHEKV